MDLNFDNQISLSKSKCWYSNNCLHFLKRAVPLSAKKSFITLATRLKKKFKALVGESLKLD
jgi:hypothetical protein